MLRQQLAQASHYCGFIIKMFAHAAGAADIRAQGADAEDAIQPRRFRCLADFAMAGRAFRAKLRHIADHHRPEAGHL